VELANTYPNDYGSTSPVTNLGTSQEISSLDYINVPKAWDYGSGDRDIVLGMSDSKILETDNDFVNKITFLPSYTYQSMTFSASNGISTHGTSTTAVAAAQGNNSYGMAGICSDCSIIATNYGYGSPGSYTNPNPNFNNLLQLALNGARVINMSWRGYLPANAHQSTSYQQWIIDELYDMGVVLVAAAGNEDYTTSTSSSYPYPASYNHVISVTSVNHQNELYDAYYAPISYFVKDMIAPQVYPNYNNTGLIVSNTSDPLLLHNTNDRVDICAPGWEVFLYANHLLGGVINWTGQPVFHGHGTSMATPHVSGTVGLMLSQNDCLNPDEVEDILQLTAKNLENIQGNEYFHGRIGAGKLETGDAVEFVYEAMNPNGNALIEGNDFWRFEFDLEKINNKLLISNQTFRDDNKSNFVAKNSISLLPGTNLKPNSNGFVNLSIDTNIDVSCQSSGRYSANKSIEKENNPTDTNNLISVFPNPNKGLFSIKFSEVNLDLNKIEIFDINGRIILSELILKDKLINRTLNVDIQNYDKGIYFVKVYSSNNSNTFKIIKN
ncbi:MAG: S8 family peptidase, partial [Flavobacterium sp.]|nr:S8 family peptidase [Flavobacterium sp.]